jgi:ATP/maltotriose-dependent transcriptional regulator MalT
MLETIREFAEGWLNARGEAASTRARHADYFLLLVETTEPHLNGAEQAAWLDRLEAEHENLRAALRWSLDSGDADRALGLSGGLWRFWFLRGYLGEGRRWLDEALAHGGDQPGPARARALAGAGILAHYQGDYGQATARCGAALELARALGDPVCAAVALDGFALVARSGGSYGAACAMYDESLRLLRQADDPATLAYTLAYAGYAVWLAGDDATALARCAESLAIYRQLGDRWGSATALVIQGLVAEGQGDLSTARSRMEEALGLFRGVGDRRSIARTLRSLGDVALEQGDGVLAQRRYAESLRAFWEIGDKFFIAACLDGLASVSAERGHLRRSARIFGAAASLRESIGASASPGELRYLGTSRARVRATLGDAAFASAGDEGRLLALEDAVALAQQEPAVGSEPLADRAPSPVLRSPPTRDNAAGLTPREIDVLRLVAQGLTDTMVADRLVVSPRTVNSHLHSIYGKLGVSSRSAATRYAIEHQL